MSSARAFAGYTSPVVLDDPSFGRPDLAPPDDMQLRLNGYRIYPPSDCQALLQALRMIPAARKRLFKLGSDK